MSTVRNAAGMCLVGNFKVFFPNDHAPEARRPPPTNTCMAGIVAPFRRMELP